MAAPPAGPARGRHFLRSRAFADELVRDAGPVAGQLALDLGAGTGMLTRALCDAGAHVVAVELDAHLAADLRRRFARAAAVRVVEADATRIEAPEEPFVIVANLPFAASTAILRRFLGEPRLPLRQADVVVEWGLAVKRTHIWPSTLLACYWGAWFELSLVRRVPREAFTPSPAVDAAVLRATRRATSLVPVAAARAYESFLGLAFASTRPLRRTLPRHVVERVASEVGFAPRAGGRDLDARQWAALYRAVVLARASR
ncbi:MAG: ribosomal RNA small subunit methyltransferase A [Gaiellaceae bacterium]